jgi:hypothetical protein
LQQFSHLLGTDQNVFIGLRLISKGYNVLTIFGNIEFPSFKVEANRAMSEDPISP